MKKPFALVLFGALLVLAACAAPEPPSRPAEVLFVGNSLTYVGNVPALYSAIATANAHTSASDMIVRGGATLHQRVDDGSVARALAEGTYTHLVIQERGGDLMCSFGAEACVRSREAIRELADIGQRHGVAALLLGTYQPDPAASRRLVEAESAAAQEAGIAYIEVSGKLQRLRGTASDLRWFAADGMHPGPDLALLNAVLVHQAIHGALPESAALTVKAPIYGSTSGLDETLRHSHAPPPLPETPMQVHYTTEVVGTVLDSIAGGAGG